MLYDARRWRFETASYGTCMRWTLLQHKVDLSYLCFELV